MRDLIAAGPKRYIVWHYAQQGGNSMVTHTFEEVVRGRERQEGYVKAMGCCVHVNECTCYENLREAP